MLDGYDLICLSFVAPQLAGIFDIPVASFGPVFTAGYVGILVGGVLIGPFADRFGRKSVLIFSVLIFGLFSLMPIADLSYGHLIVYRFITGLGLGGAMPGAVALTAEYAPSRFRGLFVNLMFVGVASGGAFGGKSDAWLEPAAAVVAHKTGRPVRAKLTRAEEFFASTVRHPIIMQYRSGVDAEGRILARQVRLILDTGAYSCLGETTLRKSALMCVGPYRVPNIDVEGRVVYTNNTVSSAMRGFGVPQVCFAWESHTESIAQRLGMDSAKFRMINAFEDGDVAPGGQVLANVGLKASMRQALAAFSWDQGDDQ